jgi:hypothetical protein
MGKKPPFQFKQDKRTKVLANPLRLPLVGTDEVVATYSDVFVILNEQDSGLASIYFYQRRLADTDMEIGTIETRTVIKGNAKCVGRVLLSQQGVEKLIEALAENRGFTLASKPRAEGEAK